MAFTDRTCDGFQACGRDLWARAGRGEQREPLSRVLGVRRGIDWHLVGTVGEALRKTPKATYAESADDGWWPGKDSSTVTSYP